MRVAVAVGLVAMLVSCGAVACASCSCGDATLTASGVEKPYRNRVRLTLDNHYGDMSSGDRLTGERSQFWRTSLGVAWTPHERITLTMVLPWISSWISTMGRPRQLISGLGDLEVSARVLIFRERGFSPHHLLWGHVGLKTPTGYRVTDDRGYPYPDDDQPGSGSWDPFAGVTYAWFSGQIVSTFVSASYRHTTPGWHDYRRGSTLAASAALQVQPWSRVAFTLGVDVVWQQPDTLANGVAVLDNGGVVTYAAPAILVAPGRDWLIRLVVSAPAYAALVGQQSIGTQIGLSIAYDAR